MGTQAANLAAVRKTVVVAVPAERAFEVFTEQIGSWWPLERFAIRPGEAATAVFEGRPGGRVYERTQSGEEADWGEVLAWEPPRRLAFSWRITEPATEVEVTFTPDGDGTRVELEHRGWERLTQRAEEERASYDQGWALVLGNYEELASRWG